MSAQRFDNTLLMYTS